MHGRVARTIGVCKRNKNNIKDAFEFQLVNIDSVGETETTKAFHSPENEANK